MNEQEFNRINAEKLTDILGVNNTVATIATVNLPSAEEYRKIVNEAALQFTAQWSEPKYQCPKCGGGMCKNLMVVLTSYPAQYEYQCDKCGHIDYQYM